MGYRSGASDRRLVNKNPATLVNEDNNTVCRIFHLEISVCLFSDIQTQPLG